MISMGIVVRTDLSNVTLPAKDRKKVFQLESLAAVLSTVY